MKTIGIFEAKTHLSEIVRSNEEVCITNRGKKIAFIIPATKFQQSKNAEAFDRLNALKLRCPLGKSNEIDSIKKLGQK